MGNEKLLQRRADGLVRGVAAAFKFWGGSVQELVLKLRGQGFQQGKRLGLGPGPASKPGLFPGLQCDGAVLLRHVVVFQDPVGQDLTGLGANLRVLRLQEPRQLGNGAVR